MFWKNVLKEHRMMNGNAMKDEGELYEKMENY